MFCITYVISSGFNDGEGHRGGGTSVGFEGFYSSREEAEKKLPSLKPKKLKEADCGPNRKFGWFNFGLGWAHHVVSYHIVELKPGMLVHKIYDGSGTSIEVCGRE
jgi:hypothetical protein